MPALAFSPQRLSQLKQHRGLAATLVLPSDHVVGPLQAERTDQRRTRALYRQGANSRPALRRGRGTAQEVLEYLADQERAIARSRATVVRDGGHGAPKAKITILLVEMVDVYTVDLPAGKLRIIDVGMARACGFRTIQDLRADWRRHHPVAPLAQLVWFTLGDVRDRNRYLQRHVSRGGDYTTDFGQAIDTLPALSELELQELASHAQQRDVGRKAETARIMSSEVTLAQRVAHIEAAGEAARREVHHELRIITNRKDRGLKKLQ